MPTTRPTGGSHNHTPSQETAMNRPMAVPRLASAGHSRSQKMAKRARVSGLASKAWPAGSGMPWLRDG